MQSRQRVSPDALQRINAEGAVLARLARDVSLGAVALREDCEEDVVLSGDAEISGEIGPGLADEGCLDEVVVFARRALDALDRDLGVRVVVAVVVANAHLKISVKKFENDGPFERVIIRSV